LSTKYKQVLVDGDTFAYRAAFSCEDTTLGDAIDKIDELLEDTLNEVLWEIDDKLYQIFLTGKGNFRHDIAITHEYKGNRKSVEKPKYLHKIRQHMIKNWKAIVSKGEEADDLIGIWSTGYGPEALVVSVDKDMLQLPCNHYNPSKRKYKTVSELEGNKFFYSQILTGDKADNIIGLYGIGPVKSKRILEDYSSEEDLYEACLRSYGGEEDRVIENGKLLWLRRHKGQVWEPPKCVSGQD
jgi:5'-3' exonuclease